MRVCSLFCGIGGIDLAFEQGGHEIVWANDSDKFACMTYRHNFSRVNLVEDGIRSVDKSSIPIAISSRRDFRVNLSRSAESNKVLTTIRGIIIADCGK